MKIEIGEQRPPHLKEYWPGQYHFFSHLEYTAGIPQLLFAISTLKENGEGNRTGVAALQVRKIL